uniref:Golgi SNAP receptor complex member 1 n=1 Tax=Panagrolaimus sp. PS1159 TaxID=55785 RepID=A0AC35G272_9BILA
MYTVDMTKAASEWDSLREEARVLGAAIDSKLHALNKYATTGPRYKAVESSHFARSKRSAFIQDAQEVEDLLKQLEEANQKLEVLMYKKAGGSSDQHAVRRYHDVLKDYMHEFHRVREVVEKQMDREDLLGGSTSQDGDTFLNNRNRSSELLLQEHEHITNTERMLDDQIKSAFIQDAQEVEDLLKQLEEANQKLEVLMYKKAGGSSDQHAVRRYHDVLKDYMHEFHRVREVVEKQMDREDLLGGSTSQDGDTFLNNRNRSSELLLQKHEHITNTERMLDDQIK